MKEKRIGEKGRKIVGTLAGVGLAVLFFVFLLGFGKTAPENPMEDQKADASHMYLTSSTLAMDKEALADVENANISSGGSKESVEEEKEEQQEQQDQQEQQQEEQQENQNDQQGQSKSPTQIDNSLMSLIRKNQTGDSNNSENTGNNGNDNGNGGGNGGNSGNPSSGGQQTTLNPSQSSALFTTSIVDGDEVEKAEYPFTITLTEKGKQLTLVSMSYTLNSSAHTCASSDSMKLKEGVNTVYVTVRFRDSKYNQIDAKTKTYTLFYIPKNSVLLLVKNTKTGEYLNNGDTVTVYEDNIWVEVTARKATASGVTDVSSRLRLNNKSQSPNSDGVYRLKLSVGNQNKLKVTAGEGGTTQKTMECTINYKIDGFVLSFESASFSEKISNNRLIGNKTFGWMTTKQYSSSSPDFAFRLSHSTVTGQERIDSVQVTTRNGTTDMKDMKGADGYIHVTLDASRSTYIKVYCTDSDGKQQYYTWEILYKRVVDPAENQKKAPRIRTQLTNETVHDNPYILPIKVFDWQGNELKPNTNFKVYLNGQYLNFDSIVPDGTYEYNLYLTEGKNTVYIYAVDNEQYTAEKTLTVTYTPDETEAKVHVIVSAEVVGLGTFFDEYVTTTTGKSVAQIVEERLAAHSYGTIYDGTPASGDYFLHFLEKNGITNDWSISTEERNLLAELGYEITEGPNNPKRLGTKDFTAGSGWMVTLNHYYIGQSMGTRAIRDGDEIHVIYTLSVGKDIGVDPTTRVY